MIRFGASSDFKALSQDGRVVLWSSTWNEKWRGKGLDHAIVRADHAEGVITGVGEDDSPYRIHYRVLWDEHWCTRQVEVNLAGDGGARDIFLSADGRGQWSDRSGHVLHEFSGCADVDIWPTPFTNTLAIRRLKLAESQRREIKVVYVDALANTVSVAPQAYTARSDRTYKFESLESGFAADLTVDDFGLVVDYPGLFLREH